MSAQRVRETGETPDLLFVLEQLRLYILGCKILFFIDEIQLFDRLNDEVRDSRSKSRSADYYKELFHSQQELLDRNSITKYFNHDSYDLQVHHDSRGKDRRMDRHISTDIQS